MRLIGGAGLVLLGLAACVEGPATGAGGSAGTGAGDPKGRAYIEVSSGGAFNGYVTTRVYADDRLETVAAGPMGQGASTNRQAGKPGVYARTRAVLEAEGPPVAAEVDPNAPACPDYGADVVRAVPPVTGFSEVVAGCPSDAVQRLQNRVLEAIAAG